MRPGHRVVPIAKVISSAMTVGLLNGCAERISDNNASTSARGMYFGYLEVSHPASVNLPTSSEISGVRVFGIKIENGVTIGYSDTTLVSVPLDCRVLIVVKTDEQLRQIRSLLEQSLEKNICSAEMPE